MNSSLNELSRRLRHGSVAGCRTAISLARRRPRSVSVRSRSIGDPTHVNGRRLGQAGHAPVGQDDHDTTRVCIGVGSTNEARRLGKGQAYVWKSEQGERRVDAVELKEFARVYGVAITFFYE